MALYNVTFMHRALCYLWRSVVSDLLTTNDDCLLMLQVNLKAMQSVVVD